MKYLMNHDELEMLLGRQPLSPDAGLPTGPVVVYFTANWCGACRRLDLPRLEASLPQVTFLKCDVDHNQFSAGYCQVRSIPAFCVIKDQKFVGPYTNSNTDAVIAWVNSVLSSSAPHT